MGSSRADLSRLHVVVPVRTLAGGKARLGEALDAEEREGLIAGMLRHELGVLGRWGRAAAVHVVSPDPEVGPIAALAGARPLAQQSDGLNEAVREARLEATEAGATALLILPADLPMLDTPSLDRLLDAADAALAAGGGAALVVVAAADARDGTNALLLSPPAVIEPRFGPASLEAHVRAARDAGASLQLLVDPVIGFDLDTPADLGRLEAARLAELEALGAAVVTSV
ncbi:MAG TPA: 2-phospho-L-lactate guanylyltransferase [Candidatus Sulfotelmatobacter sp.]|nr:2-phospho-L-lactate guanylyltransferase [Candidatus Sulfotelmatobacter sp.]